jgi:hypothetical protein
LFGAEIEFEMLLAGRVCLGPAGVGEINAPPPGSLERIDCHRAECYLQEITT